MKKYIVKKTLYYCNVKKFDTFMTKNFSSDSITDLMRKYPFTNYSDAVDFVNEKKHFDYIATIKLDSNYSFDYKIIEI